MNDRAKWIAWLGPEVEGCLAAERPLTLFLSAAVPAHVLDIAVARGVTHVFLTEAFTAWSWFSSALDALGAVRVTVGCEVHDVESVLALPFADRLSILVRVWGGWAQRLRAQDQVSIGVAYDLLVLPLRSAVRTVPVQYADDELLFALEECQP